MAEPTPSQTFPEKPSRAKTAILSGAVSVPVHLVRALKGFLPTTAAISATILKIRRLGLLVPIIILAAIPPALVIQDRWFEDPRFRRFENDAVCNANFLCKLGLPDYFYPIMACFLLIILVFIYLRKRPFFSTITRQDDFVSQPVMDLELPTVQGRASIWLTWLAAIGFQVILVRALFSQATPGWDLVAVLLFYAIGRLLAEFDLEKIRGFFVANHRLITALVLAHLSLILLLANIYSTTSFQWFWAVLFLAASINLFHYRKQIPPIFWIVSMAMVLYCLRMNNWLYLFQGDEYSFFDFARYIAIGQDIPTIGSNLFNGTAVYQSHPYFSSFIQTIFMQLLGFDSFGWRFSNMYLVAIAIGFFYLFFKRFVPTRIALLGAFFLGCSEYIMSFSKIGYNNLQALFALALVLAAGGWAVQSKRPFAFTALGFSMAFCFYVYPAALYILPIPILLLIFYQPPVSKKALHLWLYMAASFTITVFPLMIQIPYWQAKIGGTIFNTPNLVQTSDSVYVHFVSNFIFAVFSFLYIVEESHFVFSSYIDPLTGIMTLIGLSICFSQLFKHKFVRFVLAAFIILVFLAGTSHDRSYPTATRMHLLLPFFTYFAAVAVFWVIDRLKAIELTEPQITGLGIGFLSMVVVFNLLQAYVLSPNFYSRVAQFEQIYEKTVQRADKINPNEPKTFIFLTDNNWDIWIFRIFQQVYGTPRDAEQVDRIIVDQNPFSEADQKLIQNESSLVIIQPSLDNTLKQSAQTALEALGKNSCPIADRPDGNPRFYLWYSSGLDDLCKYP